MSASDQIPGSVQTDEHFLQFYKEQDDQPLDENLGDYLWQGWKAGDTLLVIAREQRNEAIFKKLRELGADPDRAISNRQLILADAVQMLPRLMIDGQPDWSRFQSNIGDIVRDGKLGARSGRLRGYGEMVAVLWEAGQYSAAIRLEHYWNELRHASPFTLFCAYPIDILSEGFRSAAVEALLCAHTHLLPAAKSDPLERALNRAMDEVLGEEAEKVRARIQDNRHPRWPKMAAAEALILWLRKNLPEEASQIVARLRQYGASATAAP